MSEMEDKTIQTIKKIKHCFFKNEKQAKFRKTDQEEKKKESVSHYQEKRASSAPTTLLPLKCSFVTGGKEVRKIAVTTWRGGGDSM